MTQTTINPAPAPVIARPQIWDSELMIPGQSAPTNGLTIFLFGGVGTVKTTWAGTFPSPVFLSAGPEGGDDSLALLPRLCGVPTPPVYQINSTKKMVEKVEYICRSYKQYGWRTVVFDSVTFYMDIYIREVITMYQNRNQPPMMQQRDWGFLETHVCRELAQRLHETQLNVIWIALHKEKWTRPDKQGESYLDGVEPLMQGGTKTKLPAMCKMILYADKRMVPDGSGKMVSRPIFRTAPTLQVKDIRHKYGDLFSEGYLVDPEFDSWPTFRALDSRIGNFIFK